MKETAINSVYLIFHCIGETEEELESKIFTEEGFLWEAYFRKDSAEKEAKKLNKFNEYTINGKIYFHKFVVFERIIF